MTNNEVKSIMEAYSAMREAKSDTKIPVRAAWIRRKNLKKIAEAYATYREAFAELQQRYSDDEHSVLHENGDRQIRMQYMPQYQSEVSELLSLDAGVTVEKIKLEDLGECNLSDSEMDTLAFMIEE